MTFWHWIHAEENPHNPARARDGALIEISTDRGDTWERIHPWGGYSHRLLDCRSLPRQSPCFSGRNGWNQVFFDLSAVTGIVQFRFRFGSNLIGRKEGWYIDDISLAGPALVELEMVPDDETVLPGSETGFSITLTNRTGIPLAFDLWGDLTLLNDRPHPGNPVIGPVSAYLEAGKSVTRHPVIPVPDDAPTGIYTFSVSAGMLPDHTLACDRFQIDVIDR